ncbi:unnamed protein product [Merluccius merluccius]
MSGMLWLILHALALVAEGGVSSGSGEVAGGNGGGNNNNGVGGGGAAGINGIGIPLNGMQPLNNPTFQVVPVGGSFFIQPFGNALAPPAPLGPVQQQPLVPFGPFQQGAGGFYLGQQGATNLIPQAQGHMIRAGAGGGGVPLYAVLSQGGNLMGGPQGQMFLQGQPLQLVPLNQQNQNNQNQQQPGPLLGGGGIAAAAGRARARRSVAAHPRRTQVMAAMGATARTAPAEEEESSGLDSEEQMTI